MDQLALQSRARSTLALGMRRRRRAVLRLYAKMWKSNVHSMRADTLISNGYRKDYPDWGHGFLDVFPEQVAQEILDFLDG